MHLLVIAVYSTGIQPSLTICAKGRCLPTARQSIPGTAKSSAGVVFFCISMSSVVKSCTILLESHEGIGVVIGEQSYGELTEPSPPSRLQLADSKTTACSRFASCIE
jgi:hypothetical protein